MKFTAAVLALAATALASPSQRTQQTKRDDWQCTFGKYTCSDDGLAINQCDINHNIVEVGPCPQGTYCQDLDLGDYYIPFCVAPTKAKRDWCAAPGTYQCTADNTGINVCDAQNTIQFNGACPPNSHCAKNEISGIPFCVDDTVTIY